MQQQIVMERQFETVDKIVSEYTTDVVKQLSENAVMISTIGSANLDEDFITNLSDIDIIIILENTDFQSLNTIYDVTTDHQEKGGILLDVRIYSRNEASSIARLGAIDALNPWTEERIREGHFKTYYKKEEYFLPTIIMRKEGLVLSMQFFMNKLRRYLHTRGFYLRGVNVKPTDSELKKTIIGSCFCIAKFYLELHGIKAVTQKTIIKQMMNFKNTQTLTRMYDLKRSSSSVDTNIIKEAYEFCSSMYDETMKEF
jgi:hypothetical protein